MDETPPPPVAPIGHVREIMHPQMDNGFFKILVISLDYREGTYFFANYSKTWPTKIFQNTVHVSIKKSQYRIQWMLL